MVLSHTAYYAAGGRQDDAAGVLSFLGVATSEDRWASLEAEWEKVLHEFRVPYFAASEYADSMGVFDGWKGKEDRRNRFIVALLHLVKKYVERVEAVGVVLDAFSEVNSDYLLAEQFGTNHPSSGAYAVAGWSCLDRMTIWIRDEKPDTDWNHIIEKGDAGQAALRATTHNCPIAGAITYMEKVRPGSSQRVRPLEVADFAAYECRHWFGRAFAGEGEVSSHEHNDVSTPHFVRDVDPSLMILERDNLSGLVHQFQIRKR